jgi:hypothetical protein
VIRKQERRAGEEANALPIDIPGDFEVENWGGGTLKIFALPCNGKNSY